MSQKMSQKKRRYNRSAWSRLEGTGRSCVCDVMASAQVQVDTSTRVHVQSPSISENKKNIDLLEYLAITVLSKPLTYCIRSYCHADLAKTFPQQLRPNTGNDIPYVLFLMHGELQGNEISHIQCSAAEPRLVLSIPYTCCQQVVGGEFEPPECIINIPSSAIIIQIPLYVM